MDKKKSISSLTKKIKRMLSLDGGGIRGLGELEILIEFESRTGKQIYEVFDPIIGTSTGGLIAILLTIPSKQNGGKPLTAVQAEKDFKDWSPRIFPPPYYNKWLLLFLDAVFTSFYYLLHFYRLNWIKDSLAGLVFFAVFLASVIGVLPIWLISKVERQKSRFSMVPIIFHCVITSVFLGLIISDYLGWQYGYTLLYWMALGVLIVFYRYSKFRIFHIMFLAYYSNDVIDEFIRNHFDKGTTLANAIKVNNVIRTVGIVANTLPYGKAFVFNSLKAKRGDQLHNVDLSLIAKATCATPTYFGTVEIDLREPQEATKLSRLVSFLEYFRRRTSINYGKRCYKNPPCWNTYEIDASGNKQLFCFEDGGTTSNNPAELLLKLYKLRVRETKEEQIGKSEDEEQEDYEMKILSIGTGTLSGEQDDPSEYKSGCLSFCECLCYCYPWFIPSIIGDELLSALYRLLGYDPFEIIMKGYTTHLDLSEKFKELGKPENYMRLQFKVTKDQLNDMDDTSKENMDSLISSAKEKLQSEEFQDYYERLFARELMKRTSRANSLKQTYSEESKKNEISIRIPLKSDYEDF